MLPISYIKLQRRKVIIFVPLSYSDLKLLAHYFSDRDQINIRVPSSHETYIACLTEAVDSRKQQTGITFPQDDSTESHVIPTLLYIDPATNEKILFVSDSLGFDQKTFDAWREVGEERCKSFAVAVVAHAKHRRDPVDIVFLAAVFQFGPLRSHGTSNHGPSAFGGRAAAIGLFAGRCIR